MKDNFAREQLSTLGERLDRLENDMSNIKQATIRYCPKCKHETVQKLKGDDGYNNYSSSTSSSITLSGLIDDSKYFTCLNCGSTIKCSTEHICEIYKVDGEVK